MVISRKFSHLSNSGYVGWGVGLNCSGETAGMTGEFVAMSLERTIPDELLIHLQTIVQCQSQTSPRPDNIMSVEL